MKLFNKTFFEENDNISINKKESRSHSNKKILAIVLSFGVAISSYMGISSIIDSEFNDILSPIGDNDFSINNGTILNVSLEEINSLNIVINDNNCSNTFFDAVCEKLNEDGIRFTTTQNNEGIENVADVVITLDQQYMAGPDTVIIAPYNNNGNNKADALSLALNTSFDEYGFFMAPIICGVSGYRETEYGVSERIPTSTEEVVHKKTSYTTISFGSLNVTPELTVSGIEGGLVRYYSYIKNFDNNSDLIYRVEHNETLDDVKLKLDDSNIKVNNNSLENQTIVNSNVKNIPEFNKFTPINLYVEKNLKTK